MPPGEFALALHSLSSSLRVPATVNEALDMLAGEDARPVAGATWLMRAPLRGEPLPPVFVALSRIEGLRRLELSPHALELGALLTHDDLGRRLPGLPDLRGLARAATESANPGVRRLATLGGSLCAHGFPASDLAAALLALDAEVEIARPGGVERMALARFLEVRAALPPPWLLTGVVAPLTGRAAAHARLPMRKAGDYPCAIVSVCARCEGGVAREARSAVGAVEACARRWTRLEAAVEDLGDPRAIETAAKDLAADFCAREALDAPAWYRLAVLPALTRRAFAGLTP
jgi:carbon-monoxide dehydrogenase medium subunit